jgi:transcriptional regulator with XRE-family HTH domain
MTKNDIPSFGPRLRELRESAGLTQSQLAERAGLHPQGVVKLERGEREPAWATFVALSRALGVELQAFLEEPATVPEPKRGRPPKAAAEPPAEPEPKRPRGRPRKEK